MTNFLLCCNDESNLPGIGLLINTLHFVSFPRRTLHKLKTYLKNYLQMKLRWKIEPCGLLYIPKHFPPWVNSEKVL